MICIYHSRDLDGWCSGAIVKDRFPEAVLIGYDYGQPFPNEKIPDDERVVLIDVSIPMAEMVTLANRVKLTWIDHHISAINEFKTLNPQPPMIVYLNTSQSACESGWDWAYPNVPMPLAVRLLGEYDTWRNKDKEHWDTQVLPFQYGMRQICNSPESFPKLLLEYGVLTDRFNAETIKNGNAILTYQRRLDINDMKAAFEIEFDGLRALCLNSAQASSQKFESVYDEGKHDLMIPFRYNGKFWIVSLYTTKDIDCSEICKKFGGGGHKKAAGFQADHQTMQTHIFSKVK